MAPDETYPGQRVELHPATDLWMRGARFATVVEPAGEYVWIEPDRLARIVRLRADDLLDASIAPDPYPSR